MSFLTSEEKWLMLMKRLCIFKDQIIREWGAKIKMFVLSSLILFRSQHGEDEDDRQFLMKISIHIHAKFLFIIQAFTQVMTIIHFFI